MDVAHDPVERHGLVHTVTYPGPHIMNLPMLTLQVVNPASGVTVNADGSDGLVINNASLLLALTVNFPASPKDGQRFFLASRAAITALSLSASPGIIGTLSTLIAGGYGTWVYSSTAGLWVRVG